MRKYVGGGGGGGGGGEWVNISAWCVSITIDGYVCKKDGQGII